MIKCGARMSLWYFADMSTLSAALGDFYCVKSFSGEVTHEAMIGKVVL